MNGVVNFESYRYRNSRKVKFIMSEELEEKPQSEKLRDIILAMTEIGGYGAQERSSETLVVAPSYITKLKTQKRSPFSEVTLRAFAWVDQSMDQKFQGHQILKEMKVNGYIIRVRLVDGQEITTWTI